MICLSERPLSLLLQAPTIDLNQASEALKSTLNVLKNYQENSDSQFSKLFKKMSDIAERLGFEIKVPRLAKKQTHRANYPATNAEEYYRRAIFVPLLDNIVVDLQERLPKDTLEVFDFNSLLPTRILKISPQKKKRNSEDYRIIWSTL